jgi:hypothetical protein
MLTVAFCNVSRKCLRFVQILIFRFSLFTLSLLVLFFPPPLLKAINLWQIPHVSYKIDLAGLSGLRHVLCVYLGTREWRMFCGARRSSVVNHDGTSCWQWHTISVSFSPLQRTIRIVLRPVNFRCSTYVRRPGIFARLTTPCNWNTLSIESGFHFWGTECVSVCINSVFRREELPKIAAFIIVALGLTQPLAEISRR